MTELKAARRDCDAVHYCMAKSRPVSRDIRKGIMKYCTGRMDNLIEGIHVLENNVEPLLAELG